MPQPRPPFTVVARNEPNHADAPTDATAPSIVAAPPPPIMTLRESFLHASRPNLPLPPAFPITEAALQAIYTAGWEAKGKAKSPEEGWRAYRRDLLGLED